MDPLTHTLVGANLASTRLGARTRLAAAACLIGANAPDIDVAAYFAGEDFAIGFRRGWTHGVLALVVLPVVLWAGLLLWDRLVRRLAARRQGRQAERTPALNSGWLFALCLISILTHPFLDWLNVYGMRWLMPFDGTWFYGDSVFIMDPWLWLILAGFWLLPRRPSGRLITVWGVLSALLAIAVAGRAPEYLPLIAIVATVLLLALLRKPAGSARRYGFGLLGLLAAGAYIVGMTLLHDQTERSVHRAASASALSVDDILVGPLPVDSLSWDVLIRTDDHYRYGTWSWWDRTLELSDRRLPIAQQSELWESASRDSAIAGFISWVRYPWIDVEQVEGGTRVYILDARYTRTRREGFGGKSVVVRHEDR